MNNNFKKIENYCCCIINSDSSLDIIIEVQYKKIEIDFRDFKRVFISFDSIDFKNKNVFFFIIIDG